MDMFSFCGGTGDAYDNLETLLNSVLLLHHLRHNQLAEATALAARAPALFFDASMDELVQANRTPALRAWRETDAVLPGLFKRIWEATDPLSRPSPLSLLDVTLSDEQYSAAQSVLMVFGTSPPHSDAFSQLLNSQNQTGETVYVCRASALRVTTFNVLMACLPRAQSDDSGAPRVQNARTALADRPHRSVAFAVSQWRSEFVSGQRQARNGVLDFGRCVGRSVRGAAHTRHRAR
jgi:hypothetical protein